MKVLIIFSLLCAFIYALDTPDPGDLAKMARYIMNSVDWIAVSTISTYKGLETYPFSSIKSVSDGPLGVGDGIPYMLLTDLDVTAKDLLKDNRTTIVASLAEIDYCKNNIWDPQDPRCGRLMISGTVSKLVNSTTEYAVALAYLIIRHPDMATWIKMPNHDFYVVRVNLDKILILDMYGPIHSVDINEYTAANNYSSIPTIKGGSSDNVFTVKISKPDIKSKLQL